MSSFQKHFFQSVARIRREHARLYAENAAVLEQMMTELHRWFDFFAGKKVGDNVYVAYSYIKHHQERHHVEGIAEAVMIFIEKFGEEYRGIIQAEAEQHVIDDMGEIYFADDYRRVGFWKSFRKY